MGIGDKGVVGSTAVLAGVFLLVGVGTAMTAAVVLVSLPGASTDGTARVVIVATFLLGPSLAGVASVVAARGTPPTAAAVAGGAGSLVGFYSFAAVTLGATLVVADAAGGTSTATAGSLVVPALVAGLPTGAVGATGGYLGGRVGGRSHDSEPATTQARQDAGATESGERDDDATVDSAETAEGEGDTDRPDATEGPAGTDDTDDETTGTGDVSDLFEDADEAVEPSS